MRVLVFDIWGDFGHFKKFYTTSSPLSFSVPPPTTVYGMLGAIVGLSKEEYLRHFNAKTTKLSLKILRPIKKTRLSINLIDTKNSGSFHLIKSRTQIKTEFLKNPAYRLYVAMERGEIFDKLCDNVRQKKTHYTLSLGLANLLANFHFVGVFEGKPIDAASSIDSVLLAKNVEDIEVEEGKKYFKERLPIDMAPSREVLCYEDVIMELGGQRINGRFRNCYEVGQEVVSFL